MGTWTHGYEAQTAAAGTALTDGHSNDTRASVTHLYHALHDARYQRQALIKDYQDRYDCNLVVMIDQIVDDGITLFAEMLDGLDITRDLHLVLCTPGGDGETALRLARMAQSASNRFVLLVPHAAKSAGTVLALAAHEIIMGPTSDLGPIDPQIFITDRGFVSAKDLIAAVDDAMETVAKRPETLPMQAAMLAGLDVTTVQLARSALARTGDLAKQAISSHPGRKKDDIEELCATITAPFIDAPRSHHAVVGAREAAEAGLPVRELSINDPQWQDIWRVWTRYFALGPITHLVAYEGERASQVHPGSPSNSEPSTFRATQPGQRASTAGTGG